jgi:PHS family inorganic phosphate transporter-like MFS transporter
MPKQLELAILDESQVRSFQWRLLITAGMGFFTDAYDLFIIGIVTALLMPIWHLTIVQLAILNGASLVSAAGGAIFFGILSDKLGRKRMYGFEILILFIGALLSAASISFTMLLIARAIVGFGIGGDYPSSAVIASESAGRKHRGFFVLLVFAMQAVGLMVGPLLASLLLLTKIPHELAWRLLLAFGAIPAAFVFYLRRRIQESPRYLLTQSPVEVSRVITDLASDNNDATTKVAFKQQKLWSKKWLPLLIGTAGAWFFLDVAFYGNSISLMMILKNLDPSGHIVQHTLISALIFLICAVPGYFLAAAYVDRIGRKRLQFLGFAMMGLMYALIALVPAVTHNIPLFLVIFGLSFFFVNFGPNTTTFLIPSEIYPANLRAKAHGISAAIGKLGAFAGAFALPFILHNYGASFALGLMAFVCVAGFMTTFLVPEMAGVSVDSTEVLIEPFPVITRNNAIK